MELPPDPLSSRALERKIAASGNLHWEMIAAYSASGTRIGAWALVSAIVYRLAGPAHFATLALIRGTIGLLNYTAVGLAPALIRVLAEDSHQPDRVERQGERTVYSSGVIVAGGSVIAGVILSALYAGFFDRWYHVPPGLRHQAPWAVLFIGLGTLLRLFSDTSGAVLQMRGRIALDGFLLAGTDAAWGFSTLALYRYPGIQTAAATYAVASALLVVARSWAVAKLADSPFPPNLDRVKAPIVRKLLSFGLLVLVAQVAEYLYAPTDYILINHFIGAGAVAAYAPAVQIDAGLLVLVTGAAAVLLPRAASAHAAGAGGLLRRYYLRATIASFVLLAVAAAIILAAASVLFRIWFGPHPPDSQPILALVLASTVIGGSSAVGRSVLLGMGKVKAYTAAAMAAGAVNVIASYVLVRFFGLGIRGIIYGTLVAVIGRCAIWMPWFVLRALRREALASRSDGRDILQTAL